VTKFTETKEQFDQKSKEVQKLEELLETLTVGMAASEGQDNGYQDQLKGTHHLVCIFSNLHNIIDV
jgi:hypothetical protein